MWVQSNSGMLGAQSEFESPCATFRASEFHTSRAHKTRVERQVLLCRRLDVFGDISWREGVITYEQTSHPSNIKT